MNECIFGVVQIPMAFIMDLKDYYPLDSYSQLRNGTYIHSQLIFT